ncbi:penicillin-binding protein activator LpoB [Candidatus Ruminimicrobiellum ovillum]|uniref:penicillin-binding protein activator LpoB n=1 Tax=Candidatus Ruminimicrobiellum ovillum TaxID=1947927 RepID=UPI0035596007
MKKLFLMGCLLSFAVVLFSCSSTPKVTRVDENEQIDLSGNWNDTDSKLVAEEMINDSLAKPWLENFMMKKQAKPRIIVGTILNKSDEHISTETFTKDLEIALLNSGKASFVASKDQREEIREERMDQADFSDPATVKKFGKELGADYMLKGQINTITDAAGKTTLKYYQTELELIDIETNEKVWIGQKKIKKVVGKSKYKA